MKNDDPVTLLNTTSPRNVSVFFRRLVFCRGEWWIDFDSSRVFDSAGHDRFGSEEEATLHLAAAGFEPTEERVAGVIFRNSSGAFTTDGAIPFLANSHVVICRPYGDRPDSEGHDTENRPDATRGV